MAKKVVVTGGAGFIGANLVELLLNKEYNVTVYDNLTMGRIENIDGFSQNPNFSFIKGDVKSFDDLQSACHHADVIVHLAAFKIPRYGNSYETLVTNNIGMKNVLDIAVENKAKEKCCPQSAGWHGIG